MSHSKHANPPDTVRIGASRFEQSPYYDYYVNPETILGVAAGRFYPSYNGEDRDETYWTLRRKAVLFKAKNQSGWRDKILHPPSTF